MTRIAKTIEKALAVKEETYKSMFCNDFNEKIITCSIETPPGIYCWEDTFNDNMSDEEIIDNIESLMFHNLNLPVEHINTAADVLVQAFKAYKEGRTSAGRFILAAFNIWMLDYEKGK